MIAPTLRTPDFFVVRAAKSGTTSLWHQLKQHPGVLVPSELCNKEPAHYSPDWGMRDRNQYMSLFSPATREQKIGDCSTAYLTDPRSATLISADNPHAKILILLRNPVDRAYSLYNWMLNNGYETAYPFETALVIEKNRINNKNFQPRMGYISNFQYFNSGLYSSQVMRYLNMFPSNQVKIILFEDFINNFPDTLRDIWKFLDVDDSALLETRVKNRGGTPWFPLLQHRLRYRKTCAVGWKHKIGIQFMYSTLMRLNMGRFGVQAMNPETRQQLLQRYSREIDELEKILERDLCSWRA